MAIRNSEKGVLVSPAFRGLKDSFQAWLDFMIKYEEEIPDDWPFGYRERPLVGFLAAAIWASGGISIEEFGTDKEATGKAAKKGARKTNGASSGRADLYFSQNGKEGNIEFKMHDLGISGTNHFANFLKRKWCVSKKDAWRTRQWGIPTFGGMFLRPFVGVDSDVGRYEENLKRLLELAWKRKPDVLAWWCPVNSVMADDEPDKKYWLVGVIMLIKQVKRKPDC